MVGDSEVPAFTLWVDADACPRETRDLVLRTAIRRQLPTVFVANTYMSLPESLFIRFELVPHGSDKADDRIVEEAGERDIVITADIPLAARLVEKNITTLNPRGEEYDESNIGERLAMRNLMQELRGAGLAFGGPKEYGQADRQRFANALDRAVNKRMKR